MTDVPLISVVIVSYQNAQTLARCLDALDAQTFRAFETILIDNASPDGAAHKEAARRPHVRFLPQTENLGFAAANNLGARAATGRWLALLNPDAFAKPEWLAALLAGAARHDTCRSFGSVQVCADDERLLDGAGDVMTLAGFPYRGGYRRPRISLREGEIFSACGAAMFIDRALFLEFGGFDERFFCFCEDADLGYRLRLAGCRTMLLPEAIVAHVGGGSTSRRARFSTFHGVRNRLWMFVKNTPPLLFWSAAPLHLALTFFGLAAAPLRGAKVRDVWDGLCAAFAHGGLWAMRPRRFPPGASAAIVRMMAKNPLAILRRAPFIR